MAEQNGGKRLLLVIRHAPYGRALSAGALDFALAAAAFDQDIRLLFMDDGVFHLLDHQHPADIGQKSAQATLASMPLYDIETFHVDAQSLADRGLAPSALAGSLELVEPADLAGFMDGHDQVLGF